MSVVRDRYSFLIWLAIAVLIGLVTLAWVISSRSCAPVQPPPTEPSQAVPPPDPIQCGTLVCPLQFCHHIGCRCFCSGRCSPNPADGCRYNCQNDATCTSLDPLPGAFCPGVSTCGS